eukprot:scaffold116546_cov38-Cyclotella_meneghiniana.AAC.1
MKAHSWIAVNDGDDDDVFFDAVSHAITHSAEKQLKDSVAAMVASELLKERGDNVTTDAADGEDLLDDLAGTAVDSQPSDCGDKSVDNNLSSELLDNEDGGGKMGSEEQRFHGELEMNYASLRMQHDFDHVTQNRKYYVTSPSFQMRMEDGGQVDYHP